MALENSDVFVLQRPSGEGLNYQLPLGDLVAYVQGSSVLQFKGSRDFTAAAEDPFTDGTDRVQGDTYINNGAEGTAAWDSMSGVVFPGDRGVWDSSNGEWIIVTSGAGFESINGTLPITVNNSDPANPIIGINQATTTTSGAVAKLATAQDLIDGTATAVVTADLMPGFDTGVMSVTGIEPIYVNNQVPGSSVVRIADATKTDGGAVVRLATADDVNPSLSDPGDSEVVVTADLLVTTNKRVDEIASGQLDSINGGVYAE